jgi:hypothetical protein
MIFDEEKTAVRLRLEFGHVASSVRRRATVRTRSSRPGVGYLAMGWAIDLNLLATILVARR